MTARATRGSRRIFLSFCLPLAEFTITCSPSESHQTGVTCGEPSGMSVPRLAKARLVKRSRYLSGMACDMNPPCMDPTRSIIERWRDLGSDGGDECGPGGQPLH